MTDLDHPLQAVFDRFAARPDVDSARKAQLYAALTRDRDLLRHLNEAAASNRLKEFALPSASSTAPNLAGTYDKASGKVTLPVSSFKLTGSAPSADLVATLRLQNLAIRFAYRTWRDTSNPASPVTKAVTQEMITNLQSTINGSPVLAKQMKNAVKPRADQDAPLQHLSILTTSGAGGAYSFDEKIMKLTPDSLKSSSFNWLDLTFVLGHEIQHGFYGHAIKTAKKNFRDEVIKITTSKNPNHDYTAAIDKVLQAHSDDESLATLAGWNAWMSAARQKYPTLSVSTLKDAMLKSGIDRAEYFIDPVKTGPDGTKIANARLVFNNDGSLSMFGTDGRRNVEQVARSYFNLPPSEAQIGYRGDSDYRNHYAREMVEWISSAERTYSQPAAAKVLINMRQLGLSEKLMERGGIHLQINPGTPQPYYDTSNPANPALHHFDHTSGTHQHVANVTSPAQEKSDDLRKTEMRKTETPAQKSTPPEGGEAPVSGPSGCKDVNQFLAAMKKGDRKKMDEISVSFRRSPEGMELAERAFELREEQQSVSHGHTRGHSRSIPR